MPALLWVPLCVALLDQASKWLILEAVMNPPRTIEVTGFFNLVLVYNRGVSFGFLAMDSAWSPYLLAMAAMLIAGLVYLWGRRQRRRLPIVAAGMVVGGALGNAFDRLYHGAVVDFLDFHAAGWHWPAFNLADSAIVLGVGLLIVDSLFGGRPSQD